MNFDDEPTADEEPTIDPAFDSVDAFVEGWLSKIINRRIGDKSGLKWDPCWWRHPEVDARLTALWWAWETARATVDDGSAMSNWWIHHCDPHMRVLLDAETGPMSGTREDGTWRGHGPLPCKPRPDRDPDQLEQP